MGEKYWAGKVDKNWSDTFNKEIISILKKSFNADSVTIASKFLDLKHATDFVVDGKNISCRVNYDWNYGENAKKFTFRYKRESGAETEFKKVLRGDVDYGIWCRTRRRKDNTEYIHSWFVVDLNAFSKLMKEYPEFIDADEPGILGFFTYNAGDKNIHRYYNIEYFKFLLVDHSDTLIIDEK